MSKLIALSLLLSVAACASAEERRAELAAKHDGYCRSIGAKPGTEGYTTCRLKVMQMYLNAMVAEDQADAIRSTAAPSGPIIQSAPMPSPPPMAPIRF
jgi:hypothetical protein